MLVYQQQSERDWHDETFFVFRYIPKDWKFKHRYLSISNIIFCGSAFYGRNQKQSNASSKKKRKMFSKGKISYSKTVALEAILNRHYDLTVHWFLSTHKIWDSVRNKWALDSVFFPPLFLLFFFIHIKYQRQTISIYILPDKSFLSLKYCRFIYSPFVSKYLNWNRFRRFVLSNRCCRSFSIRDYWKKNITFKRSTPKYKYDLDYINWIEFYWNIHEMNEFSFIENVLFNLNRINKYYWEKFIYNNEINISCNCHCKPRKYYCDSMMKFNNLFGFESLNWRK